MNRKFSFPLLIVLSVFSFYRANAQSKPLGMFDGQDDIGTVSPKGTATYNAETQQYTLSGSGANIWSKHDDFHFLWKKMKGDFILRANVQFVGKGVNEHRKIGLMIRSALDPTSKYVDAAVHGVKLVAMQYRIKTGDSTLQVK